MKSKHTLFAGAALALTVALSASSASAAFFTGTGDAQNAPQVAGGTMVGFESIPLGSYVTVTDGGVSLTGVGGDIRVDNSYAGSYNGRGTRYVDNNAGTTPTIEFNFAAPVSAFAFNWGAADNDWTLTLFNGATAVANTVVAPTFSSNAGDYVGWTGAAIDRAVLTNMSSYDYVFVDNVTYVGGGGGGAVPEPATWAMMMVGFLGLGAALRAHRRADQKLDALRA